MHMITTNFELFAQELTEVQTMVGDDSIDVYVNAKRQTVAEWQALIAVKEGE